MTGNGLREIRIDMIMNIGRERRDGERERERTRRSDKCTNASLVSPAIINVFFLFSSSSRCSSSRSSSSSPLIVEEKRKDNWTVSFFSSRRRETCKRKENERGEGRRRRRKERTVSWAECRCVFSRCSSRKTMFITDLLVVSVLLLIFISNYPTSSVLLPPFYWNQTSFRYEDFSPLRSANPSGTACAWALIRKGDEMTQCVSPRLFIDSIHWRRFRRQKRRKPNRSVERHLKFNLFFLRLFRCNCVYRSIERRRSVNCAARWTIHCSSLNCNAHHQHASVFFFLFVCLLDDVKKKKSNARKTDATD